MGDDKASGDVGPRPLTVDEVRDRFIRHVRGLIDYWENLPGKTTRERMDGVVFSILVSLDGESAGLPKFIVAPDPHPSDKEFCKENGIDWWRTEGNKGMGLYWPQNCDLDVKADISGCLHEWLCAEERNEREALAALERADKASEKKGAQGEV